jgi:uncharacterized protein (DUF1330 family)
MRIQYAVALAMLAGVGLGAAAIKKAGGKILAASLNVTQLEGPAPTRVVIQVWDSPEQIAAWRHGPDYDDIRKIGERYAIFRSFAVEGLPLQ